MKTLRIIIEEGQPVGVKKEMPSSALVFWSASASRSAIRKVRVSEVQMKTPIGC
jgi:hypothetical protein